MSDQTTALVGIPNLAPLAQGQVPFFNVRAAPFAAPVDGVTDASAAFIAAIAAAAVNGGYVLCPAGTYALANNVTVPANVTLAMYAGAIVSVAGGKTLTINGPVDLSLTQHFSGTGTIVFGTGHVDFLYPQWWGALVDAVHDDSTAINAALTAASSGPAIVRLTSGTWSLGAALTMPDQTQLVGARTKTVLKPTAALAAGACIVPGNSCICEGFLLDGSLTTGANGIGVGLTVGVVVTQVIVRDVTIKSFIGSATSAGILLQNAVSFRGENLYLQFSSYGVITLGDVQSCPTDSMFENCTFYEANHKGAWLQTGWSLVFLKCVFESCMEEGIYAYNAAGTLANPLRNVLIESCWFEVNWLSLAGNAARGNQYHIWIRGINGAWQPTVTIRHAMDNDTPGTQAPQFLRLTDAVDFVLDNCFIQNVLNVLIEGTSFGKVPNWRGIAGSDSFYKANYASVTSTGAILVSPQSGTFTPTFVDQHANPTSGGTYAGFWSRHGKRVTVTVTASNIATVGMTAGDRFFMNNLPFASAAAGGGIGPCLIAGIAFTKSPPVAQVVAGATNVLLWENATGATGQYMTVAEITSGSGALQFTVTYLVP